MKKINKYKFKPELSGPGVSCMTVERSVPPRRGFPLSPTRDMSYNESGQRLIINNMIYIIIK